MGACKLLVKENEGILVCGNNTRVVRIRVRDINYISCDFLTPLFDFLIRKSSLRP